MRFLSLPNSEKQTPKMKSKNQLSPLLLSHLSTLILFHNLLSFTQSKSVIESCYSSNSCPSLLSYHIPWDSKISQIAYRFQLNVSGILASNSIYPINDPSLWDKILPPKTLIKVPISCPCVDGIRRSVSTLYTIQAADTLDSISDGFGGLVSVEQIKSFNGISEDNFLMNSEIIVIPLPCTCFGNSDNGVTAVYLSYVVQRGDNLSSIGAVYGTTVSELEGINGLGQPQVDPGDILAIPISACSSENLNWINESTLIVPNGSYSLTANNCIRCNCGPTKLNLQCVPSGIVASCSHLQCQGSNLFIGGIIENQTAIGCNVSACIYRGHSGRKIHRSLVNSSHVQCSGNRSYDAETPLWPPISSGSPVPFSAPSPLSSPSSASYPPGGFHSFNQQSGNRSRDRTPLEIWHLFFIILVSILCY